MKEILILLKGLSQEQGEKLLEEKGYVIDDSFSEKCVNSNNRISDTYYREKYGNHDEWFCYTTEYIPDEDYEDEGEFIRGNWNCNTENIIAISELNYKIKIILTFDNFNNVWYNVKVAYIIKVKQN